MSRKNSQSFLKSRYFCKKLWSSTTSLYNKMTCCWITYIFVAITKNHDWMPQRTLKWLVEKLEFPGDCFKQCLSTNSWFSEAIFSVSKLGLNSIPYKILLSSVRVRNMVAFNFHRVEVTRVPVPISILSWEIVRSYSLDWDLPCGHLSVYTSHHRFFWRLRWDRKIQFDHKNSWQWERTFIFQNILNLDAFISEHILLSEQNGLQKGSIEPVGPQIQFHARGVDTAVLIQRMSEYRLPTGLCPSRIRCDLPNPKMVKNRALIDETTVKHSFCYCQDVKFKIFRPVMNIAIYCISWHKYSSGNAISK